MTGLSLETLIALLEIPGMGRRKTRTLLNHGAGVDQMPFSEIVKLAVDQKLIKEPVSASVLRFCQERAKEILEKNDRYGIKLISIWDKDYPKAFAFNDGPILIYYLGNRECLNEAKRVAVIGSRKPQKKGRDFAFWIGKQLAKEKWTVVSGLAFGCDTAAHQGCLSENGQTISILPSGLLNIYPEENRYLAEEILEKNGCLLSEYSLETRPKAFHFIERDRLQAGISDFLVVSTFSPTGGTLHTLKYAHSYGKKILTIPQIIDQVPNSFLKLTDLGISYERVTFSQLLAKLKE